MIQMQHEFDYIRNRTIGSVESVSPREIKVLLEINAPENTAINTGIPQPFPRVNGFVLMPNESGALIGIISWIGIERSDFPKRTNYKDFDLIDLPFPLRKLAVSPIGVLKENSGKYEIERGVYSYPTVGDIVIIPNKQQLRAIVQNKDEYAKVKIGISPMAANAEVFVNPDRVFGRHIAILGNTGSGKSCSVAGLIRWSLEAAKKEIIKGKNLNARFIVLDPNGEYCNAFDGLCNIRKYQVKLNDLDESSAKVEQLKVPGWIWNSYEWSSIAQASGRTQRPLMRQALREIRSGSIANISDVLLAPRRFITSILISLRNFENKGVDALAIWPGKNDLGSMLESAEQSLSTFLPSLDENPRSKIENIITSINQVLSMRKKIGNNYPAFILNDIKTICDTILDSQTVFGELVPYQGPDEDSPNFFKNEDFINHLEQIVQETNAQQYMDFFMMRVRSILNDARIASVIDTKTKDEITLEKWLSTYIGNSNDDGSINIIDLSLLPSEILFVVVSVLSRVIFESHQRYRRKTGKVLPTTFVVEEAHNFIKWYDSIQKILQRHSFAANHLKRLLKKDANLALGY
jgi:hypothetical protein